MSSKTVKKAEELAYGAKWHGDAVIIPEKRQPIQHELLPLKATLNITYACDLNCVGCGRAGFIKPPRIPPMTIETVGKLYDEARSLGVQFSKSTIGGGEPTLHPDFHEIVAIASANSQWVRITSNAFSKHAKEQLAALDGRHPNVKIIDKSQKLDGSRVFQQEKGGQYINPTDAGIYCPFPCRQMLGLGCGMGVDQLGYALCPPGGTIDSFLGLGTRATTLKQQLDRDFIVEQAAKICAHCGRFMRITQLPELWDHNGTPMSASYHKALTE